MDTKMQIVEDIMNALLNITLIDYVEGGSNSKDGKTIEFKHNHNQLVNAVIRNVSPLCSRDWEDFTIIRDESIATIWQTMNKISHDFTESELLDIFRDMDKKELPITHKFFSATYKLSCLTTKCQLSGHRRSSGTMVPAFSNVEYNDEALNSIGIATDEHTEANICFFLRWFEQNKESILTRRQLEFLNDESTVSDKNISSYKKRIYNATITAFQKEFTDTDNRINELQDQVKTIERILESKDFPAQIIKYRDKSYINDALTSYVDLPIMQRFNRGDYSPEVLKQYRVSLFKALNNINNLLNQMQNSEGTREDV
jgi:hypothetical protein